MALFSSTNQNHSVAIYKLQHYPRNMIPTKLREAILRESGIQAGSKAHILSLCNEDLTKICFSPHSPELEIKWLFNNIPSEEEWAARSMFSPIYYCIRYFREHNLKPVIILSFSGSDRAVPASF